MCINDYRLTNSARWRCRTSFLLDNTRKAVTAYSFVCAVSECRHTQEQAGEKEPHIELECAENRNRKGVRLVSRYKSDVGK